MANTHSAAPVPDDPMEDDEGISDDEVSLSLFVEQEEGANNDVNMADRQPRDAGNNEAEEEEDVPVHNTEQELKIARDELAVTQRELQLKTQLADERQTTIENLSRTIQTLQNRKFQHTQRTWPDELRQALADAQRAQAEQNLPQVPMIDDAQWEKIYKQCCKEENMSTQVSWVHPSIELSARLDGLARCRDPYSQHRPKDPREAQFKFMSLPIGIQKRIFELWLHKHRRLVHCFSRLDPHEPLAAFPTEAQLGPRRSGLNRGFYWGVPRRLSISQDLQDGDDVLRVLRVNKHFNFLGTHCFYGMNTFAFSSLGEFYRFCQGSGQARVERIQHIEITLVGNQYLTAPRQLRPNAAAFPTPELARKPLPPFSLRTHALRWLQECRRLRTLVVHINEQAKSYMRRGYESVETIRYMVAKTNGQGNVRMSRSLRTVQGIDHIYQLRGLAWVRFYDLEQAQRSGDGERYRVRDWSFEDDIRNVCTMEKVPTRKNLSELENLKKLVPDPENLPQDPEDIPPVWTPSDELWDTVKGFYHAGPYDSIRINNREVDVASRVLGSMLSNIEDTSSEESDSDSGSSSRSPPSSFASSRMPSLSPSSRTSSSSSSSSFSSSSPSDSDGGDYLRSALEAETEEEEEDEDEDEEEEIEDEGEEIEEVEDEDIEIEEVEEEDDGVVIVDEERSTRPSGFIPPPPSNHYSAYSVWPQPTPRATTSNRELSRSHTRDSSGLFVTPTPADQLQTPEYYFRSSIFSSRSTSCIDLTDEEDPRQASESSSEASSSLSKRSSESLDSSSEASISKRLRLSGSPEALTGTS
ncbi:hypothetical protein B0T16DRAFT_461000 [Cercophora newfieldiana]|uniref:Uncharacterized protein n=1 Tax=Cercophora newfieldiana TaxID=92897 RepID=A0AA39XV74_9PEZI|nr:hypothetical protein B0T16DRAFT_461000 [Cercophora newfieldiana]